jgi:uncharacterized protein (TIGR02996 family)
VHVSLRRNTELEEAILEDPLDPAAWLVYGDWLQSEGDPRGELVAVQAHHARDPGNPVLLERQRELFGLHGPLLTQGLEPWLEPTRLSDGRTREPLFRVSWEFGFLWTATASSEYTIDETVEGLRALLDHPSGHFLHALALPSPTENQWPRLVYALSEKERPLRILLLGTSVSSTSSSSGADRPSFNSLGDIGRLWSKLPHLRSLDLRGGVLSVGSFSLPHLRELTIATGSLQRETLLAIANREWPHLERLELWFGSRRCTCTLPDLAAIFEGAKFPRLRHLGLRNCAFVDRICNSLTSAKITKQLHVLDLSLGALTGIGVSALVSARRSFEHLAVLDLHHHYVDSVTMSGTKNLARFVDTSQPLYTFGNDDEALREMGGTPNVWLDV